MPRQDRVTFTRLSDVAPGHGDETREGPVAPFWRRRHLTVDQRTARGRAARQAAPRSEHGRWCPAAGRPDPVALLEQQAMTRVPELVPIRYGRMAVSPFTFYRGAAAIMAADLAPTSTTGITTQLCGDAHLSNFGVFGTPERRLIFDINDFDETLPGPWEWDIKRLAASFEVMGRGRGFSPDERATIVTACAREYRERMRRAAGLGTLSAWYNQLDAGGSSIWSVKRYGSSVWTRRRHAEPSATWPTPTRATAHASLRSARLTSRGSCES